MQVLTGGLASLPVIGLAAREKPKVRGFNNNSLAFWKHIESKRKDGGRIIDDPHPRRFGNRHGKTEAQAVYIYGTFSDEEISRLRRLKEHNRKHWLK